MDTRKILSRQRKEKKEAHYTAIYSILGLISSFF